MSWTTRAGRFLSFMWKSGTTGVQGLDEDTAQSAVESAIERLKGSYPELAGAKKAIVRYEIHLAHSQTFRSPLENFDSSKPHPTAKADGRIDPLHANFQITNANNQPITSAHSYANPLGGRYVWFSKPKYNNGQEAKQHFPQNPASKKTDDGKDTTGQRGAGQGAGRGAGRGTRTTG